VNAHALITPGLDLGILFVATKKDRRIKSSDDELEEER
jgi:hypothetical protein